jgi:hypothetical protein
MSPSTRLGIAISGVILGMSGFGMAAADEIKTSLDGLAHCAAIASSNDRLACYDVLSGRHAGATLSVAPAAAQQTATKQDFGLTLAQKEKTGAPLPPRIESITGTVTSLGQSSSGRMLVILDNGQTWELDSADPLLAAGNVVTIQHGSLGAFLLMTPSKRTHHARRIR